MIISVIQNLTGYSVGSRIRHDTQWDPGSDMIISGIQDPI